MKMKRFFSVCLLVIVAYVPSSSINAAERQPAGQPEVKNVIFLIGDGMGVSQVYAGMTAKKKGLTLERAQFVGFSKTYSTNRYITDSAAGGTAIACGVKTTNGTIGMDANGNEAKSMLAYAHDNGMATGVIVTCSVTDATPAAFMAHRQNRSMEEDIALDISRSGVDVLIGGGSKFFNERADKQDLIGQMRGKGYLVSSTFDEVSKVSSGKLLALVDTVDMPAYAKRGDVIPKYVEKAIQLLDKPDGKGFFLMVEGSQIDGFAHVGDGDGMVGEVLDFDSVVKVAFDYADKNPNTLVVITADHETGGAYLTGGDFHTGEVQVKYGTKGHTGVMVPIFAYGAQAYRFAGIQENTAFLSKVLEALEMER